MWSAESPKAPRLTKVLLSGQFSARRKKQGEKGFSLWDRSCLTAMFPRRSRLVTKHIVAPPWPG